MTTEQNEAQEKNVAVDVGNTEKADKTDNAASVASVAAVYDNAIKSLHAASESLREHFEKLRIEDEPVGKSDMALVKDLFSTLKDASSLAPSRTSVIITIDSEAEKFTK